jgi:transcriptional regulator with XRE-family HTH domain
LRKEEVSSLDWSQSPKALAGVFLQAKRVSLGLRQKDLAALIPTSVTTVAWLEQGRAFSLSDKLFQDFCRALGCNVLESTFLLRLRQHDPNRPVPTTSGRFWQKFVEPFVGPPMLVTNHYWNVLVRNDPANNRFQAFTTNKATLNLLEQLLALGDPNDDRSFLLRQIDQFRIDSVRFLGQSAHTDIVDRLRKKSELFAERWHSPVFSPDADETFLVVEGNRVRVERMYDTERGFVLHLFNFSST